MITIKDMQSKIDEFDFDCLMTIKDFKNAVNSGCIISYDGFGNYIDDNGKSVGTVEFTVKEINKKIKQGIKFVCWYNK